MGKVTATILRVLLLCAIAAPGLHATYRNHLQDQAILEVARFAMSEYGLMNEEGKVVAVCGYVVAPQGGMPGVVQCVNVQWGNSPSKSGTSKSSPESSSALSIATTKSDTEFANEVSPST